MVLLTYYYPGLNDELFRLRESVFIFEQHFPYEIDERDNESTHVGLYNERELVGVARYFPIDDAKNQYIVGRFAIRSDYRGIGLGRFLIRDIENHLKELGAKEIIIHSQSEALEFYKKCGYIEVGDPFIEEGHLHQLVKKVL